MWKCLDGLLRFEWVKFSLELVRLGWVGISRVILVFEPKPLGVWLRNMANDSFG